MYSFLCVPFLNFSFLVGKKKTLFLRDCVNLVQSVVNMAPKVRTPLKEPPKVIDNSAAVNSNVDDSPFVNPITNPILPELFVTDNNNIDIQARVAELVAQQFALQMAHNIPLPVPYVNNIVTEEATISSDTVNSKNMINHIIAEPTVTIAPADVEVIKTSDVPLLDTVTQAPKHVPEANYRYTSPQTRPSPKRTNSYERAKAVIEKMNNSDSDDEDEGQGDRWFYAVDKAIRNCVHASEISTLFNEGIHCLYDLGLVIDDIGLLPLKLKSKASLRKLNASIYVSKEDTVQDLLPIQYAATYKFIDVLYPKNLYTKSGSQHELIANLFLNKLIQKPDMLKCLSDPSYLNSSTECINRCFYQVWFEAIQKIQARDNNISSKDIKKNILDWFMNSCTWELIKQLYSLKNLELNFVSYKYLDQRLAELEEKILNIKRRRVDPAPIVNNKSNGSGYSAPAKNTTANYGEKSAANDTTTADNKEDVRMCYFAANGTCINKLCKYPHISWSDATDGQKKFWYKLKERTSVPKPEATTASTT